MFYDLDENMRDNFRFPLESNTEKEMSLKSDCEAGKTFKCSTPFFITVEGKHESEEDWVNMSTTGIDLTPWADTIQVFNLRFSIGLVEDYELDLFYFYTE